MKGCVTVNNLNSFEQGMMAATIVVGFVILILLVFVLQFNCFIVSVYIRWVRAGVEIAG